MTSSIDLAYLGSMVLVARTGYVVQYSSGAEFSLPIFLSLFFLYVTEVGHRRYVRAMLWCWYLRHAWELTLE